MGGLTAFGVSLLEISTHGVHLHLLNRDATIIDERPFTVVQLGCTIAVCVISNLQYDLAAIRSLLSMEIYLMIVPSWNPWVSGVGKQRIKVTTVGSMTLAEIIKRVNDTLWLRYTVYWCAITVVAITLVCKRLLVVSH